jgi:hypothetical protein
MGSRIAEMDVPQHSNLTTGFVATFSRCLSPNGRPVRRDVISECRGWGILRGRNGHHRTSLCSGWSCLTRLKKLGLVCVKVPYYYRGMMSSANLTLTEQQQRATMIRSHLATFSTYSPERRFLGDHQLSHQRASLPPVGHSREPPTQTEIDLP